MLNEKDATVLCLPEAPDEDSAYKVRIEAHSLLTDEIIDIKEEKKHTDLPDFIFLNTRTDQFVEVS